MMMIFAVLNDKDEDDANFKDNAFCHNNNNNISACTAYEKKLDFCIYFIPFIIEAFSIFTCVKGYEL